MRPAGYAHLVNCIDNNGGILPLEFQGDVSILLDVNERCQFLMIDRFAALEIPPL
jgi:hypothetical protein